MGELLFFSKMIDMIITRRPDQALIIVGGGTLNNIERRDKEIAYIVRCIDNKNDIGKISEESMIELDSKIDRISSIFI